MLDNSFNSSGNQSQNVNVSFPFRFGEGYNQSRLNYCPPLTLEQHLFSFSGDKAFQFLWSSWISEKEQYRKQLETVPATFFTYSSHTVDHSEIILTRIEAILGTDRIRLLSPTDTWLLLQCAYTHDLGMCVSEPEKEKAFENCFENVENFNKLFDDDDFLNFLYEIEQEYLKDPFDPRNPLFTSVRFLLKAKDNNDDQAMRRLANQLKSIRYSRAKSMVALVTMSYFRKKHAERTRELLLKNAQDNTNNGVFPIRLRQIVAEIDYCHGGSWNDVMKLHQQETGFSSDYIHPQFIAALLRLGDLLDLDSNRFNEFQIDRLTSMPKVSIAHELKHMAITDLLVTTKEIRVTARYNYSDMRRILDEHYFNNRKDLSDEEKDDETKELIDRSAKSLREWLKMIEDDLKHFSNEWNSIIPDNMTGSIASFKRSDIYVLDQTEPVEEDNISLRYTISPARSAQLIEGADLYRSVWAFVREITQNAIDASKRQLGRDACHYSPRESLEYPSFPEYYLNLQLIRQFEPVRIIINFIPGKKKANARLEFIFIDYGIGITYEKLKQMRHIGAISRTNEEILEIKSLPTWLKPTGEFGIGMQSVFSLADSMTILTYPDNEEGKPSDLKRHIKLYCPELGGDIVNREERRKRKKETNDRTVSESSSSDRYYHGTDVRFHFELIGDIVLKSFLDKGLYKSSNDEYMHSQSGVLMPEMMYAYLQKKNKISMLDEEVIFSQLRRYINETFTNDLIGLNFYFLKNIQLKQNQDWREFIHDFDKHDRKNTVIKFRFPKFENRILNIPNQKNFLSQSTLTGSSPVYYWYNYEAPDPLENESVLLTLKNIGSSQEKSKKRVSLFYRGIAVCVKSSTASLFSTFAIPGIDLSINIMSGNVSSYLEINREYVKATGFLELGRVIRNALRSFYHSISKWELEKKEVYNIGFWKNNPEHRLFYHLVCRFNEYEDTFYDDCDDEVDLYSIYSKITKEKKKISSILSNGLLWFTDLENIPLLDTLNGNTAEGLAIPDKISDVFNLKYHTIQIVRSKEWLDQFNLRYTLTKNTDLPIEITDEDYGILCTTILRQYLDKHIKETGYLKENVGNYILSVPSIERYKSISVDQIPAESPGKYLTRFNRFIILPFKIKDLISYYEKLYPDEAITNSLPVPVGSERKAFFSDNLLRLLAGESGDTDNLASVKFAKQMQKFIDQKILSQLEQGLNKKEVYKAYSQLLKMFHY